MYFSDAVNPKTLSHQTYHRNHVNLSNHEYPSLLLNLVKKPINYLQSTMYFVPKTGTLTRAKTC